MFISDFSGKRYSEHLIAIVLIVLLPLTLGATALVFVWEIPDLIAIVLVGGNVLNGLLAITLQRSVSSQLIWHPLVGPSLYIQFVCFAPIFYMTATSETLIGRTYSGGNDRLLISMALTVLGYWLGVILGMISLTRRRMPRAVSKPFRAEVIEFMGFMLLGIAAVARVTELVLFAEQAYGQNQVAFGLRSILAAGSGTIFFLGVILTCIGNISKDRSFSRFQWTLIAIFAVSTLAVGERGVLIAPMIFAVMIRQFWLGGISARKGVLLGIVLMFIFLWIGAVRSDAPAGSTTDSGIGQVVHDFVEGFSSPVIIQDEMTRKIPIEADYRLGSTYLEAMKRQLPGPLSMLLFGPPTETGAMVYRDIMNLTNPNHGMSFAFPAEAYINFGLPGNFVMSAVLGVAFGFGWRKMQKQPISPLTFLYLLLFATLVLGFRSDALTHIKIVLYPLIAISVAFGVAKRFGWKRRPQAGLQ